MSHSAWLLLFFVQLMTLIQANNSNEIRTKRESINDNVLGNKIRISPYNDAGYNTRNGRISDVGDLNCNFESPCCWKNSVPPQDTMEWVAVTGEVDSDKFTKFFHSSSPENSFLTVMSDVATGPPDKANLQSCKMPCVSSLRIKLKHYLSSGVMLHVCEAGNDNVLFKCVNVPGNGSHPMFVTLTPGSDISIVLVAFNLLNPNGNIAIIKEITVEYELCKKMNSEGSLVTTNQYPQTRYKITPTTPKSGTNGLTKNWKMFLLISTFFVFILV